MTTKQDVLVAIDAGNTQSGIVIIIDSKICLAKTSLNEEIVPMIKQYQGVRYRLRVIIEDIEPYGGNLSPQTIDTCKWIGELSFRLKTSRIAFDVAGRSYVKKWVYRNYGSLVEPMIRKKIDKKGLKNQDGGERKSSFVWVDDSMVVAAMRQYWGISVPNKGSKNEYGLNTHSWQALGLATFYSNDFKAYVKETKILREKRELEKKKKKDDKKAKNKKRPR